MINNTKKHIVLNFSKKTVLITGGTRGIGLAIGLAFARYGAQCVLTYSWGDHDNDEIYRAFKKVKGLKPILIQADVSISSDTDNLIQNLLKITNKIDVFISNVSSSSIIKSFEDYSLNALKKSISYSAWPMISYIQKIKKVFGVLPNYIIGISSTGPDHYSYGYDFVSASKTVMECMCRYLGYRFRNDSVTINAVRSRAIKTQSFEDTFGKELSGFANKLSIPENYWIEPEEIANVILGLCSGYCDTINGQIIDVDRGTSFFDNLMEIYTRYKKSNLNFNL